ncbi:MAG: hypothetical protein ISR68_01505 [Campylobacterales bacterium]|nr:hypothetical protein [Campylobacterales bacterium]
MIKSKILPSDRVLLLVKSIITLEVILLVVSFFNDTLSLYLLFSQNIGILNFISFLLLLAYFFWHYIDAKKKMTCTGCKIANTGGNVVIYSVILLILYIFF